MFSSSNVRRLVVAVLAATCTYWSVGDAFAQRKARKDKDPAEIEKEKKEKQAYDLYQEGITHYNLGEFDAAIEKFKAAYALTGAPGLLFNVAQAYRLKKDYEQALYFYKTYLRLDADAPNKADVEARIVEMDRLLQEQQKLEKAKPVGTIPPGASGVPDAPAGSNPSPPNMVPAGPGGTSANGATPGGTTVAASGGGGDDGGSAVSGGGETGITGSYVPHGGTLGAIVRADVDTGGKGAAFAIGVSYSFTAALEAHVGALVTGKVGATAGVTFLFSTGKWRPLAMVSLPTFFEEGTHVGVHGAVGLRYDLSANLGLELDLGAAHFFSAPTDDFTKTYFIPSLGIQGRL